MLAAQQEEVQVPAIVRAGMVAVLSAIGSMSLAGPAQAADDKGRPSDRALAPLVACRPIPDVRARALCYDAALDKLQQSVSQRTVVVMDREQVKADFGFGGGKPLARSPAARVAMPEGVDEISATVVSTSSYGYDLWDIRLATGAVWRTTEASVAFPPKQGQTIQIRRGILGSYTMMVGRRALKVKRVN